MHPCFVRNSLSSQGICFIRANNKMNYLFSGHDPGLLEEGPSFGKKSILKSVVPSKGKGRGSFFLAWFGKKMFTYFLMLGGPNYFRACSQGFTLFDYANLISFTIHSSLPKLWDCKYKNLKNYIQLTVIMKIMTKWPTP